MNVQLVESLIQVILSLAADEQLALAGKILKNIPYPSTQELVQLAQKGGYCNFLNDELEIYTLKDQEAIA
ncbi:hypothetical protein [Microcoleus asticus]|uniref:Nif11 domain-containing protein n=1 Tax=Microcoleus asticus IPMA8 TaxID=2563858 RepID=A0ABX2CW18_9CYAN|nr:hypothetical protein [Microcoleus asticus]NQE34519.1 hypothetical protein [Microcoleus asticus IPMA8]